MARAYLDQNRTGKYRFDVTDCQGILAPETITNYDWRIMNMPGKAKHPFVIRNSSFVIIPTIKV